MAAVQMPPPLREGDRLTAAEFLRRWEAMPDLKFAELIDGIVFMPSPVSRNHGSIHFSLSVWLGVYADSTPGCEGFLDTTSVLGEHDVPQPDLALRIQPEAGGQSRDVGEYVGGAPELVVEVTNSTSSRDLGIKLDLYRRAGVREYLSVLVKPRQVIWRQLVRGRYKEMTAYEDGLFRSNIFPGLWLNPEALWDSQISLRTAVDQGIASLEHAAFIRRLATRSH